MKFLFLVLAAALVHFPSSQACTTFQLAGLSQNIIADSFERDQSYGMAIHNKRNVQKTAILLKGSGPLKWKSRFSSLTFQQHGREFPLMGMNEKGLVVETLILSESVYPQGGSEGAANELQWVQFILDTASSIPEAIAQSRLVRVVDLQTPVHYFACDAEGECATFEYLGGKMAVHSGSAISVPALTNNTYSASVAALSAYKGFGGSKPIPRGQPDSLSRFVVASSAASQYSTREDPIEYSFRSLENLTSRHQWSVVWEPKALRVHFNTVASPARKTIDLNAFPAGCSSPVQILNMEGPGLSGDVTGQLRDYTTEQASAILKNNPQFFNSLAPAALAYPDSMTRCQE